MWIFCTESNNENMYKLHHLFQFWFEEWIIIKLYHMHIDKWYMEMYILVYIFIVIYVCVYN